MRENDVNVEDCRCPVAIFRWQWFAFRRDGIYLRPLYVCSYAGCLQDVDRVVEFHGGVHRCPIGKNYRHDVFLFSSCRFMLYFALVVSALCLYRFRRFFQRFARVFHNVPLSCRCVLWFRSYPFGYVDELYRSIDRFGLVRFNRLLPFPRPVSVLRVSVNGSLATFGARIDLFLHHRLSVACRFIVGVLLLWHRRQRLVFRIEWCRLRSFFDDIFLYFLVAKADDRNSRYRAGNVSEMIFFRYIGMILSLLPSGCDCVVLFRGCFRIVFSGWAVCSAGRICFLGLVRAGVCAWPWFFVRFVCGRLLRFVGGWAEVVVLLRVFSDVLGSSVFGATFVLGGLFDSGEDCGFVIVDMGGEVGEGFSEHVVVLVCVVVSFPVRFVGCGVPRGGSVRGDRSCFLFYFVGAVGSDGMAFLPRVVRFYTVDLFFIVSSLVFEGRFPEYFCGVLELGDTQEYEVVVSNVAR